MPKAFLDTNILVYASDQDSPAKRNIARTLLRRVAVQGGGVISTQVIQEFFVSATRKLAIEPLKVKAIVATFRPLELVTVTLEDINNAMDGHVLWQVSFWDALILSAAERASCSIVYSEDLNAGQMYGGVEVKNPFAES
jgi:predicted nucleic acid-binding protein